MPLKTEENNLKRTEEVQDIIEKIPGNGLTLITSLVVAIVLCMFLLGWMIKYPETISGSIKLTSQVSPVRLVAQTSGKLDFLKFQSSDTVPEGKIFAIIESSASIEDINTLDSLLANPPDSFVNATVSFPKVLEIGDLTSVYFRFQSSLRSYENFLEGDQFRSRKEAIEIELQVLDKNLSKLEEELSNRTQSHFIKKEFAERDSILFFSHEVISRDQFLNRKLDRLNSKQAILFLKKEIALLSARREEPLNKLERLELEEEEYRRTLTTEMYSSYNELKNLLAKWKSKFAFIAPYTGTLEVLGFWQQGDFIIQGNELFSIIPHKNTVYGQILLPATGSGKVEEGQEVIIKLENYPFKEFGSLRGTVNSISNLSNELNFGSNQAYLYKVLVSLPNQLVTNYNKELGYEYEIRGRADIILSKRRLLERLFDNLKYYSKG